MNEPPKVMIHIIMPGQISGPNITSRMIAESDLNQKYHFGFLTQNRLPGGMISLSLIRDLMKQIKSFNPDLIHIAGLQNAAFHAVVAARLCGRKKLLLTVHGTTNDRINSNRLRRMVLGKIIEPITLRLSHSVYTVCEAMARRSFVRRHARRFLGCIHNAAPAIPPSGPPGVDLRKSHRLEEDVLLVAIVGRIVHDKGITYIADAIKALDLDKVCFVFIGDGPLVDYLKENLGQEIDSKKVLLLGKQNDVIDLLRRCDIFLFATLHENLSNALLEACALGLAVIATDVGGNPEVITHELNGILIPPSDPKRIADAVKMLASNPADRSRLGANARKTIEERFSRAAMCSGVDAVYASMLDRPRPTKSA